jgi:alpha-1,2-mannosyltransferase
MATIDPVLSADAMARTALPRRGSRSHLSHYLLRAGAALAFVAFASFCIMWVQWVFSATEFPNVSGDFVSFWTAGLLALQHHAADAYREVPHYFAQLALDKDPSRAYLAFFYPPYFLLLCAVFASLPYLPALCLWLAGTCACYAAALRAMVPRDLPEREPIWLLLLGYPAVMLNIGFGQNGFLSAALFGAAAALLDRWPTLAGVCLGCLSYKPQLGIVVPLALVVAKRWRCFAAAAVTVLALAAVATLVFGSDIWPAFLADSTEAKRNWMEGYNPPYLRYWITVFGAVRLHGGSLPLAYALQATVSVSAVLLLVVSLRRRPSGVRSGRAEIAAIAACVPFCSPFLLEYDLVILAVPMVWLLSEGMQNGFRRGEGAALVAAYLTPVAFKIMLFDDALKLSVIATSALLFAMVLRRLTAKHAEPANAGAFAGSLDGSATVKRLGRVEPAAASAWQS